MDRLACVDVPDLALQILLRNHPEWVGLPVAALERDSPQATILQENARARSRGIHRGLRYGEGLSIEPALRAAAVSPATVEESLEEITRCLQRLSPQIEPATDLPGIFWLNATGLVPLYPSLAEWARTVRIRIGELGFQAVVVVGFTRFGTYAAARMASCRTPLDSGTEVILECIEDERNASYRVPLDRLDMVPELQALLAKLGVRTVGTFLRLPAPGLLDRFGAEAHRLHRFASGDLDRPLVPRPVTEPIEEEIALEQPVVTVLHLVAIARQILTSLLERLAGRRQAVTVLHVLFALDTREHVIETLRPATPTLDATILLELLHLRLHGSHLPAGVVKIQIRVETTPARSEQTHLFTAAAGRDLQAAARALARLRAEFGEAAVVRARLREGHLPEARFAWEPTSEIVRAHPRHIRVRPLVRRIYARPLLPLPPRPQSERTDPWLIDYPRPGRVERITGPYIVSGGWWVQAVHREYHFVETQQGDILWVFYDRNRRRWFRHGRVE